MELLAGALNVEQQSFASMLVGRNVIADLQFYRNICMTEIKTTNRTVLRRMLRDCDRLCAACWPMKLYGDLWYITKWQEVDARRREIRRRLKERRDG